MVAKVGKRYIRKKLAGLSDKIEMRKKEGMARFSVHATEWMVDLLTKQWTRACLLCFVGRRT